MRCWIDSWKQCGRDRNGVSVSSPLFKRDFGQAFVHRVGRGGRGGNSQVTFAKIITWAQSEWRSHEICRRLRAAAVQFRSRGLKSHSQSITRRGASHVSGISTCEDFELLNASTSDANTSPTRAVSHTLRAAMYRVAAKGGKRRFGSADLRIELALHCNCNSFSIECALEMLPSSLHRASGRDLSRSTTLTMPQHKHPRCGFVRLDRQASTFVSLREAVPQPTGRVRKSKRSHSRLTLSRDPCPEVGFRESTEEEVSLYGGTQQHPDDAALHQLGGLSVSRGI